jgi:hypothetical protein
MNEKFDMKTIGDIPTILQLSVTKNMYPKLF